ncbi:hypothetical protein M231_07019 [Tremella mesenterica]|uniref:Secretion-regulating guanine nucleotide exchange factor n=1 Tax=Tremella mesenterica TaxID=5217 RepID=A0A4V1M359_TREME|nr:hypothetical protein M231_07019 [Tremella mesenterica]
MPLYATGSNSSGHLSISHQLDVSTFTQCQIHPTLLEEKLQVMDISSSSSHTLLLSRLTISSHCDHSKSLESSNNQSHHTLNQPFSSNGIKEPLDEYRNILLGAGTNTLGQLGPLCLLSSKPQTYTRFKPVDLLTPLGLKTEEWEPVKIAVTWSSSFVVYRRILTSSSTSQLHSQSSSTSQHHPRPQPTSTSHPLSQSSSTSHPQPQSSNTSHHSELSNPDSIKTPQRPSTSDHNYISRNNTQTSNNNKEMNRKINGSSEILIACGSNDFGELGYLPKSQPDKISITLPNTTPNIVDLDLGEEERIKFIKGGQRHVICVIESFGKKDRVIGWGASRKGELDGSICFVPWNRGDSLLSPMSESERRRVVDGETEIEKHRRDTSVIGIGKGKGKGKGKQVLKSPYSQPTEIHLPIPPEVKIVDISLGASHTLVLLSNGNVLAWGNDTKSQITGLNPVSNITDSSEIGQSINVNGSNEELSKGGCEGTNTNNVTNRESTKMDDAKRGTNVIGIAARWTGSYILDSERKIWSQGSDTHSQLLRCPHSSSSSLQSPDITPISPSMSTVVSTTQSTSSSTIQATSSSTIQATSSSSSLKGLSSSRNTKTIYEINGGREIRERKKTGEETRTQVSLPPGRVERIVAGSEHLLVLFDPSGEQSHDSMTNNDTEMGIGIDSVTRISEVMESGVKIEKRTKNGERSNANGEKELELWTGGWNEHGNLGLGHLQDRDRLEKVSLPGKVLNMWAGCANSWILVDGWEL